MVKVLSYLLLLAPAAAFRSNVVPQQRRGLSSLKMSADEYTIAVLGDLHLDPRYMEDHYAGREHFMKILEDGKRPNSCVVSLGDLGESKSVDQTKQLFAGTSACLKMAADYLESYKVPYEVVGGNHDLEGIDEFSSDEENLQCFLKSLNKPTPQFKRLIAPKTMLLGLGSTLFREAAYTSHEVYIDKAQIDWFEKEVQACPAEEGWKIFIFSHAPPMGCGLRVLQENHVVNGCCWLNHSSKNTGKFIDIVRKNPSIKAWFSGHFHLGQDYQDSITFPQGNNRGCCTFIQTAVMAKKSSRDGRQQSRLIRGSKDGFTISTIDHAKDGKERLDATISFTDNTHEGVVVAHESEDYDHDAWFSAYTPREEDGCYVDDVKDGLADAGKDGAVCWWHMACGRVLGVHNGMVLEYDASTLAPLGLVISKDELKGRQLAVIDSGLGQQDGAQIEKREQAVILYDEEMNVTVVQPNEDGSYWRKIVRNKMIRMKEKRREKAAVEFAKKVLGAPEDKAVNVKSSWGPYTSTVGTAKTTSAAKTI